MNNKSENVPLNYTTYLQLSNILSSQKIQSGNHHDEMLFIIIHQAYELWFKQIIHELCILKQSLITNKIHQIMGHLKRLNAILRILMSQADTLETMSPFSFYSFRQYLGTASGFQSLQFREIEFLLGIKNESKLKIYSSESEEFKKLYQIFIDSSIWDDFLLLLKKNVVIDRKNFNNASHKNMTDEQVLLLYLYIDPSIYTEIAELLLDFDEKMQEWRYRHVKIVERMIGSGTPGSGGSKGFEYLKNTITLSFCPELWNVKNQFYAS